MFDPKLAAPSQPQLCDLPVSTGLLARGSEGPEVRGLQEKLNQAGAQPRLDTDGVYGERTEQAVRDFQKRHALSLDGIAGPETLRKLDEAPRSPAPGTPVTQPSRETPAASGVSGLLEPIVQQDGTSWLTQVEGNRVRYADPADGQMKWTTKDILDAQPAHTDGRWFSRLVQE